MTEPGRPPDEPQIGSDLAGTRRTKAFSDGVFAIVITLLVLDLASPEYRPGGLGAALTRQWSSYLAFAVSFVYVGVIWLNHHALFRRIRRLDLGLNWINQLPQSSPRAAGTRHDSGMRPKATRQAGHGHCAVRLSGLAGWFINPVSIILMIIYHAVTSEGLQEGPLRRLIRRKEQN